MRQPPSTSQQVGEHDMAKQRWSLAIEVGLLGNGQSTSLHSKARVFCCCYCCFVSLLFCFLLVLATATTSHVPLQDLLRQCVMWGDEHESRRLSKFYCGKEWFLRTQKCGHCAADKIISPALSVWDREEIHINIMPLQILLPLLFSLQNTILTWDTTTFEQVSNKRSDWFPFWLF